MEGKNVPVIYGFPGKVKSAVWRDFGFYKGEGGLLDKSTVICRYCHHGMKYTGNTSNLHNHVERHRRAIVNAARSGLPVPVPCEIQFNHGLLPGKDFNTMYGPVPGDTSFQSATDESEVSSGQHACIRRVYSCQENARPESLHVLIGEYLIENMLPPETVETKSFMNMMLAVDSSNLFKLKEFHADVLLTQLYDTYSFSLTDMIRGLGTATLTLDTWRSMSEEVYMTVSAHVIASDWKFQSYVLTSKPKPANLLNELEHLRDSLDIKQTPFAIVDDSSCISAPDDGIIIHCLGLAIHKAAAHALLLGDVPNILQSVVESTASLPDLEVPNARLLRYVNELQTNNLQKSAHWIEIYDLLREMTKPKDRAAFRANVGNSMFRSINEILNCLKPLKSAVEHMLEQSEFIVSMVLPVLRKLELSLAEESGDSKMEKELKGEIWNRLSECYEADELKDYLLISSLLDPRFKELLFVDVSYLRRARESLVKAGELVCKSMSSESPDIANDISKVVSIEVNSEYTGESSMKKIKLELDDSESEPTTSASSSSDSGYGWLSDVVNKKTVATKGETKETVRSEIDRYSTVEQTTSHPLAWWKSRQSVYPILSKVARQYLCTPATSLPPDIMFKTRQGHVSARRSLLPDELIEKMVFLNSNYSKLKE